MALNAPPGPPPKPPMPPGMATPMQPKQGGQEARGEVLAGLALELLRRSVPLFAPDSDMGLAVVEVVAKLGRKFRRPPADLGQAELKFMSSQLGGGPGGPGAGGPPTGGAGAPGAIPPTPPTPPGAPAEAAAA